MQVADLAVLVGELLALEAGQAGEAHVEDGLGLALAQEVVAALLRAFAISLFGTTRAPHELLEPLERKLHQGRRAPRPGPSTRGWC